MADNIIIRRSRPEDFEQICALYADAREFMKENGNPDQWKDTHPSVDLISEDISENGNGYVAADGDTVLAAFYFEENADDPTYRVIYDGKWLNSLPYAVVHRIGVSKAARGRKVGKLCVKWATERAGNVKIDTHRDNQPMQRLLTSLGFVHCGTIYVNVDGDRHRMAYQYSSK
ncbi:MAG: GNAT family N-acetyltransferase [Ruminococcaceae bacterium]|nr:GNAT family N-acetyltransferase [Oscillospiraceae bacterium]